MLVVAFDGITGAAFASPVSATTNTGMIIGFSWVLFVLFMLGFGGLQLLLSLPWRPLGVARTFIAEAMAYRVVVGMVAVIFLGIVALPLLIAQPDVDQQHNLAPLNNRIQQHLSFSFLFVTVMLSLMTLVLSCWSLSTEVEQRQVYTTLTKPLSRGHYLLGKWLGITLLNALIVTVVSITTYSFIAFYLADLPTKNEADTIALENQVLTARISAEPLPPDEMDVDVDREYLRVLEDEGPYYIAEQGGEEAFRNRIRGSMLAEWRSLAPAGQEGSAETYVFEGLKQGLSGEFNTQLQYYIRVQGVAPDTPTRIRAAVNGIPITPREGIEISNRIRQTLPFDASLIDEGGRAEVYLQNLTPGASMVFSGKDSLRLMHQVGGFADNFARAAIIVWIKLMFLAALGLTMSTFLNFYVAILGSLLVLIGASSGSFIVEAAMFYATGPDALLVEKVLRWIALIFAWPLQQYSQFKPADQIVEGLYISWGQIGRCVLVLGVIWTGLTGLLAWGIFARRELARVQV